MPEMSSEAMTMMFGRREFLGTCAGTALVQAAAFGGAAAQSAVPSGSEISWTERRRAIMDAWLDLLGPFPREIPELKPEMKRVDDIQGIECHYVTVQSEPDERIPGYLLIPEPATHKPGPAVLCVHPTTKGAGKKATVGLCGAGATDPAAPPERSWAYGLELARWGYVTLSIDLLGDGDRIPEGLSRYDTRAFYRRHPDWSAVGKNIWDVMRAMDFLAALEFVDASRVACLGHSLGGHTSLFSAAFDPRISAAVCNGGVYSWRRDEDHWSRPERAQSEPVESYIYIRRFRPYLDDPAKPAPADFEELMMLVAPRPLLLMQTESEFQRDETVNKAARAAEVYRRLGAGDRIALFSYPGEHNYPPVAKRFSFSWLDRWFHHTPAIPTIWPNVAI
jgi:dienelactone hydrolase